MCAALNSEPLESETPVEYEDLVELAQLSLTIYESLRDEWDYMNGNYIGKSQTNLFDVFRLYNVPEVEHLLVYKIISIIDSERRHVIRSRS